MMQVTFREISKELEAAGSQIMAAEAHGCLCGALCTSADYVPERWLDEVVSAEAANPVEADDPCSALRLLFADTQRALRGQEMEFEPLLPDDEESLESRAVALSQWCQGFLYGFGSARTARKGELSAQVDEILRDLTHIARASVDVGGASEEEEQAYAEVVEYLRVGVQLIYDELAPVREAQASLDDSPPGDDESTH